MEVGVENVMVFEEDNLNIIGWGIVFFDVNNDIWEDFYVVNGRIFIFLVFVIVINDFDKLYLNNGDKIFMDISDEVGVSDLCYVYGMAYLDYDEDGDLDIVIVVLDELGGYFKFYVNEIENDYYYLQFYLIGVEINCDVFGSWVWVYVDSFVFVKEIYGGGVSYVFQYMSVLYFGLGDNVIVDFVWIEWINGYVDLIENLEVDKCYIIVEGVEVIIIDVGKVELGIVVVFNFFIDYLELIVGRNWIGIIFLVCLMSLEGCMVFYQELLFIVQIQLDFFDGLVKGMYLLELIVVDGIWNIFKVIK